MNVENVMPKKIIKRIILPIIVLSILTIMCRPQKKIIYSPLKDGKCITILDAFPGGWFGGSVFVIPGKYNGLFPPKNNFLSLHPESEQILSVNWNPNDRYALKICLPVCDQEYDNKLDTTRYMLAVRCKVNVDGYIDKGEQHYYPKYKSYIDWLSF